MKDCSASKSKGSMFVAGLVKNEDEVIEKLDGVSYRTLTGALIHLACYSRGDISFETSTLCKYNANPGKLHWAALKQLLRYLKYTANDGLLLGGDHELILRGFADSGFASDKNDGKSPGGFIFFWGQSCIAFKSKWFTDIFPSSTETELHALYLAVSMAIWLRKILRSFGFKQRDPILIAEDNTGAIKYSLTKESAGRMKHIDIKIHWIREKIKDGSISLIYCKSEDNVADIFTKTLRGVALDRHRSSMGYVEVEGTTACQHKSPRVMGHV